MSSVPDRSHFEARYAAGAPWDIGRPQPVFVAVANEIQGSVLDCGCGTGDLATFLAKRGNQVTGFDYLEGPIQLAKQKAAEQGIAVTFLVKDATTLKDWNERFDNIVDSGVFHVFSDDDRKKYVAGLAAVLKPGGRLRFICFSNEEPGTVGPRRVTQQELYDAFSNGWEIESIKPARFEVRNDLEGFSFSPGGPKAWLVTVLRE